MFDFKSSIKKNQYEHYFPPLELELDLDIRKSYKGGFTYLNPLYKEKEVKQGVVLDVNSLYPYVMYEKMLPFGDPVFFEGQYEDDICYPLYIQMITCSFELKMNKIPTIQIKNSRNNLFNPVEYLTSSENQIVCLTLTNVDLKLFLEQYDVYDLKYECGWKFKGKKGMFKTYIEKWYERKRQASISGNKGQRTLSKLMLNSLYGKFATSLKAKSKIPYLEDDIVHYKVGKEEQKKGLYIPIRVFYNFIRT